MELQRLTTVFDVDLSGLQSGRVQVDAFFSDAEKRAGDSVSRFDRISRQIGQTIGTGIKVGLGDVSAGVDALINITEKGLGSIPYIGGAVGAAFKESAGAMRDAVNTGLEFDDMMKRSSISLGLIAGGANDATKELAGLRSISANSEFGLPTLISAAEQLQLMQGNAHNVVPEIQAIADAASALGRGEGGLNAIVGVLARINEMEKVSGRDAKALVNQGIPIYDIIGQAAGMSSARAKRLIDTGRIQVDTFTDAILGYFQQKYPQAAEQMAQTIQVQNAKLASGYASLEGVAFQGLYDKTLQGYTGANAAIRGPQAGQIAANIDASTKLVQGFFANTLSAIESGDLSGKFQKLGADAVKSAMDGIDSGAAGLYGAAVNAGDMIEQGWRDRMKQHSPSQVMYDLGLGAGLSLYSGFLDGAKGHNLSAEIDKLVQEAAEKYKIDPNLIRAIIKQESSGRVGAVSPAGARGLMQLMPGTARRYGVTDPFDPAQNIDAGAHYLSDLLKMFGDLRLAIAAYNAGEGAVQKYGGVPPYAETQAYVPKVMRNYTRLSTGVDSPVSVTIAGVDTSAVPSFSDWLSTFTGPHTRSTQVGGMTEQWPEDPRAFAQAVYNLSKNSPASDKTTVAAQSDFQHQLSLLQSQYGITDTGARLIEDEVAKRLEVERQATQRVIALRDSLSAPSSSAPAAAIGPSLLTDRALNANGIPDMSALTSVSLTPQSVIPYLTGLDEVGKKQEAVFGQKAQRDLRGLRGELLQMGLDLKTVGDEFETDFASAFDHIGEAGHNFFRDLALSMVQDIKHNVGTYLAGEFRDDIFGSADGKKKGLLGALGSLLGIGGKTGTDPVAMATTLNTQQTVLNTTAIQANTQALYQFAASQGGGGSLWQKLAAAALGGLGGGFIKGGIGLDSPIGTVGKVTPHAMGGAVAPGEWSLVGERGPELVRFGSAAHVYSNSDSIRMFAAGENTYHTNTNTQPSTQHVYHHGSVEHRGQVEVRMPPDKPPVTFRTHAGKRELEDSLRALLMKVR